MVGDVGDERGGAVLGQQLHQRGVNVLGGRREAQGNVLLTHIQCSAQETLSGQGLIQGGGGGGRPGIFPPKAIPPPPPPPKNFHNQISTLLQSVLCMC